MKFHLTNAITSIIALIIFLCCCKVIKRLMYGSSIQKPGDRDSSGPCRQVCVVFVSPEPVCCITAFAKEETLK